MKFSCDAGCGRCCSKIGQLVTAASIQQEKHDEYNPLTSELKNFPYGFDEKGKCLMLTKDNKCSVYDTRPLVCNIKEMWKIYFYRTVSKKQFFKMNKNVCNKLKAENESRQIS